jgi:hypothetical protein
VVTTVNQKRRYNNNYRDNEYTQTPTRFILSLVVCFWTPTNQLNINIYKSKNEADLEIRGKILEYNKNNALHEYRQIELSYRLTFNAHLLMPL